jgi:hypothetical protein
MQDSEGDAAGGAAGNSKAAPPLAVAASTARREAGSWTMMAMLSSMLFGSEQE